MPLITRDEQDKLTDQHSEWRRAPRRELDDSFFDGEPLPREIVPRHWLPERRVHDGRRVSRSTDSTRYLRGPQVTILRDDIRRLTWVATVERGRLVLTDYLQPAVTETQRGRRLLADGDVWRCHITLNKFSGEVIPTWITRNGGKAELWHGVQRVRTDVEHVDFPHFAYSQVPIGRVQSEEPPFGVLAYKSRESGQIVVRRVVGEEIGPEQTLVTEPTVGGASLAVFEDHVLARVDLLREGQLVPGTFASTDGANSFSEFEPIDISPALGQGFLARPGYQRPIVDKGGAFHVPVGLESASEALALNYVVASDILVEAIRVEGRLLKDELAVFPSTLGSGNTFGNGVSDGHGLIMVLSTDKGQLFSSNSSAGGSHFPEAQLLNHEMPLVCDFSASECYSSGLIPNVVSMDYLFVECNEAGRPVSGELYIETWDMPLPLPRAEARGVGNSVEIKILNDADLEAGKVTFGFDDPSVTITDVRIKSLREATVLTDREDLRGKTLTYEVLTLFHRHCGEVVVA